VLNQKLLLVVGGLFLSVSAFVSVATGDLIVTQFGTKSTIDFASFTGAGFSATPAAGQLDSDDWSVVLSNTSSVGFGETATSGAFALGPNEGSVGTGGIYAFDASSGAHAVSGGSVMLGVQPTAADFTPGSFTLRVQNGTGREVPFWDIEYDIYVLNDQGRANAIDFSYAVNSSAAEPADNAFVKIPSVKVTSPEALDVSPVWTSSHRAFTIAASTPVDGRLFLRWTGDDVSGTGSRDEFGLDNIGVTPNPEPSTIVLVGLGAIGFLVFGYWRRQGTTVIA
jgi:hypothetical protein